LIFVNRRDPPRALERAIPMHIGACGTEGIVMKILLALDGSACARAATDFIASRTTLIGRDPEIAIFNVQPPLPARAARALGRGVVRAYHATEADHVLRPAIAALKKAGLAPSAGYVVGVPSAAIAARADKERFDLIVMGSHGHGALAGLLMGSCASGVLARTRKPLLMLRARPRSSADALDVGVAVDGSAYSLAAVRFIARHRDLFGAGARFTLIHVAPDFAGAAMPDMVGLVPVTFSEEELRALRDKSFERAVAPSRKVLAQAGIEAAAVCLGGNAGDEIARYARSQKLGLLVLGSHGLGAFKRALLGSVATRVAAHCDTPLLLIRKP
jgi:nucleotide-binding universal stress UspA family protein